MEHAHVMCNQEESLEQQAWNTGALTGLKSNLMFFSVWQFDGEAKGTGDDE